MSDVAPVKLYPEGLQLHPPKPLAEFQLGDVVPIIFGGTGASSLTTFVSLVGSSIALSGLSDTTIVSPSNGYVLTYNISTGKWIASAAPGAGGGEANTASNLGIGPGSAFSQKVGVDLQFRTLSGINLTVSTVNASTIVVSGPVAGATSGQANTMSNLGTGPGLYSQKVGDDLQLRSFSGINIFVSALNTSTLLLSSQTSAALLNAITAINSQTGVSITIQGVSGLAVSSGNNTINIGADYTSAIWNASALKGKNLEIVSPTDGELLRYNGSSWVNYNPELISVTLLNSLIGDITLTGASGITVATEGAQNNINIKANYTSAIWNASAFDGIDISGVPVTGQVYVYDGTRFVTSSVSSVAYTKNNAAGAVFPTSPTDGQMFYRTDLTELFCYDNSRTKWLSVRTIEPTFTSQAAVTVGTQFRFHQANIGASDMGPVMLWSAVLVEIFYTKNDTTTVASADVIVNAGTVKYSFGLPIPTRLGSASGLNVVFNQNDVVGVICTNAAGWTGGGMVTTRFRRYAT